MSIPKSVTSIGDYAFDRCGALVGFVVDPDNPAYMSREGVLLTKGGKTLLQYHDPFMWELLFGNSKQKN